MNSRARLFGGLLAAILLLCTLVIFLDSRGTFGGGSDATSTPYSAPAGQPASPTAPPSGGGDYGGL